MTEIKFTIKGTFENCEQLIKELERIKPELEKLGADKIELTLIGVEEYKYHNPTLPSQPTKSDIDDNPMIFDCPPII